jgi:ribosome-binding ATPase YchF (GTP1/OBG family)
MGLIGVFSRISMASTLAHVLRCQHVQEHEQPTRSPEDDPVARLAVVDAELAKCSILRSLRDHLGLPAAGARVSRGRSPSGFMETIASLSELAAISWSLDTVYVQRNVHLTVHA